MVIYILDIYLKGYINEDKRVVVISPGQSCQFISNIFAKWEYDSVKKKKYYNAPFLLCYGNTHAYRSF